MATYSGNIESISINGREFPVSGSHVVSESLVTDYTGPGWLAHFKKAKRTRERFEYCGHGSFTVEKGSEAWEELVKACRYHD